MRWFCTVFWSLCGVRWWNLAYGYRMLIVCWGSSANRSVLQFFPKVKSRKLIGTWKSSRRKSKRTNSERISKLQPPKSPNGTRSSSTIKYVNYSATFHRRKLLKIYLFLQFSAVKKKLIDRDSHNDGKYAQYDTTLKKLEQKLRNGTALEQGQRGANKVSAMAAQLTTLNQPMDEKVTIQKSVRMRMFSRSNFMVQQIH